VLPPPSHQLTRDLEAQRCFGTDRFCAYFLSPLQFQGVAAWVGSVRALTYRRISPHGPSHVDLDGRDAHYWHLLVWDRERGTLAGSLRMALSAWQPPPWDGNRSYLEHCYPGLDASLRERGLAYAEIGRTFVAAPYQRTSLVLMVLLQAMVSIPLATGHHHLLGMVSYNHFAHSEALNDGFLAALLAPPYRDSLGVPPARHPLSPAHRPMVSPPATADYAELERWLEEHYQEPFRVPVLMRRYAQLGNARVVGLSLARDFNQITEILMHCELDQLTARQRRRLVVDDLLPVWRGLVDGTPSGA
jgi:hypothetical protein